MYAVHDAAYWRRRAEQTRAKIDQPGCPNSRKTLLKAAAEYDRLAALTERWHNDEKAIGPDVGLSTDPSSPLTLL